MDLIAAAARAQVLIKALSGIKGAPETIPDKPRDFPFSIAYVGEGTWGHDYMDDGKMQDKGEIIIELYLCAMDRGIRFAMTRDADYLLTLPKALVNDDTLNANITTQGMGPPTIKRERPQAGEYAGIGVFFRRWRLSYEGEVTL